MVTVAHDTLPKSEFEGYIEAQEALKTVIVTEDGDQTEREVEVDEKMSRAHSTGRKRSVRHDDDDNDEGKGRWGQR